jgi:hypothetical protein
MAALLVTAAAVYVGLRDRSDAPRPASDSRRSASPSPTGTQEDLATLDLSDLPIPRTAFCDVLDEDDVEAALGGPPTGTAHYDSGDRVELTSGVTDVSHEYGCTFDSAVTGAQARAWVFAEPVTPAAAASIAREARRTRGCTVLDDAPTFGASSTATLCRTTSPVGRVVTLRGLFGDAWLSCQLRTPGADAVPQTVQRAEQWCVRVATTVGARP